MPAIKLSTKSFEKPWGCTRLPALFPDPAGKRIGEIWFEGPDGQHLPLLVKYIFTSEKLSIQVHPDDKQAKANGLPGGKSECWYILDAEPGATLGIGTTGTLSGEELRTAALDGSIEGLVDWKPVQAGSFFYIPAGTVHAIGGGVTLVEVQQNNDITYRLFDYGRPRELHLDDGVAASRAQRYALPERIIDPGEDVQLLDGSNAPFSLDMTSCKSGATISLPQGQSWFIPLSGSGVIDGQRWKYGECWLVRDEAQLHADADCAFLIASSSPQLES